MDKYIEAEMELAGLLGYSQITTGHFSVGSLAALPRGEFQHKECLPSWCRDDAVAFRLAVEYGVTLWIGVEAVSTYQRLHDYIFGDAVSNHPDKFAAARYCVVKAVIQLLKEKQE